MERPSRIEQVGRRDLPDEALSDRTSYRTVTVDFSEPSPMVRHDFVSDPYLAEEFMNAECEDAPVESPIVFYFPHPAQIGKAPNRDGLTKVIKSILQSGRKRGVYVVTRTNFKLT